MLRLKVALLIRIISRQRQYMKSEAEQESRAIIVFKRHYEIALANEMRGYARAYAQIEIYWKIENMFSYSSCLRPVTDPSDVPVHRGAVSPTRCIGLHETAACMQLRGLIRGRLEKSFRRGSKLFHFSPARTLFHHVSKKASRDGRHTYIHTYIHKRKHSSETTNLLKKVQELQ